MEPLEARAGEFTIAGQENGLWNAENFNFDATVSDGVLKDCLGPQRSKNIPQEIIRVCRLIMSSDLDQPKAEEDETLKKSAEQILAAEIHEGITAIEFSVARLFVSGLSAGLDIGFSVLVMGITWTLANSRLPVPIVSILMANSYAVGFIFVVIGRSELFTEQTTLAVLPVFDRKASVASLL